MKRLVEREFPPGTIEAKVSVFLNDAEPFQVPAGAKQRVRARLVGAPVRGHGPWLLRPAVAIGVLTFVALAGAGVWRSQWRSHAAPPAIMKTEKGAAASAQPTAPTTSPAVESLGTTSNDPVTEGSGPARSPEPSVVKGVAEPQPALSGHRAESAAAVEASVLFEATGALRRDGDAARASRILDDYFRRFPRGALGEEALALAIEAASVRGDARARTLAKRYLDLYPRGNFRAKAERVLARTGE